MRRASRSAAFVLGLLVSTSAMASPTTIVPLDTLGDCDPLTAPAAVEELGFSGAFPVGEVIAAAPAGLISTSACAATDIDNSQLRNARVSITNQNAVAFSAVWYIANPGTVITNIDGTINGLPAFQIDTAGTNVSLVSESGAVDGIFSPFETWLFILQDYTSAGLLGADAFTSIGIPDSGLPPTASGSIIAVPVPEPGTVALVALGLVALAARGRTRS